VYDSPFNTILLYLIALFHIAVHANHPSSVHGLNRSVKNTLGAVEKMQARIVPLRHRRHRCTRTSHEEEGHTSKIGMSIPYTGGTTEIDQFKLRLGICRGNVFRRKYLVKVDR
jgi:hypothetical protein